MQVMEILLIGRIVLDQYPDTTLCGGNVLNVATNLVDNLDSKSVHLISAINPQDHFIVDYLDNLGISYSLVPTTKTPTLQYNQNHQVIDVNLYDIHKDFTAESLQPYVEYIRSAKYIVCDLGSQEVIEFVYQQNPKACLIVEPISVYHIKNLSKLILNNLFLLKGNRHEIETLTGLKIINHLDCYHAEVELKRLGVKRAFITLDKDGAYYFGEHKRGKIESKIITNQELIGAGDAFLAGILYALRITKDMEILADYGNRQVQKYMLKRKKTILK